MENRQEFIEKMAIKLKVLDSRIRSLETITDEVLSELNAVYRQQLEELNLKKEEIKAELNRYKNFETLD